MRRIVAAVTGGVLLAGCGPSGPGAVTTAAEQTTKPVVTIDERPDGPSVSCTGLDRALPAASPIKPGKPLPRVSLACLGGGPNVTLADVRGPAVLNVWASWCGPCADEIGYLVEVERALHGRVRFIGLDVSDEPADARVWNDNYRVTWPSLRDPHGAVRGPLHVPGPPVTFFIGSDGTIAGVHYGAFTSADEVRRALATKLGVGTPASAKGLG
jgi:cytochrome c biogenesis protein CcmG/thiol:disulfide interchange protein DsbE